VETKRNYGSHVTILISLEKLSGHLPFQQIELEQIAGTTSKGNCKGVKLRLWAF